MDPRCNGRGRHRFGQPEPDQSARRGQAVTPLLRPSLIGALTLVLPAVVLVASTMPAHFSRVHTVNEAVIRGDLNGAREAAAWIAEHQTAEGLPAAAHPYLDHVRRAARDVAAAADLRTASLATARLAVACGDCHAALGVRPSPAFTSPPVIGGVAGHMLVHQRAVELMFQGLVTPSTSMWTTGANLLRTAPLRPGRLPHDARLTAEIRTHELRVHALAESARYLAEPAARASLYAPIIAGCAACHTLHSSYWGPQPPPIGH
jgi:hypothetical protein